MIFMTVYLQIESTVPPPVSTPAPEPVVAVPPLQPAPMPVAPPQPAPPPINSLPRTSSNSVSISCPVWPQITQSYLKSVLDLDVLLIVESLLCKN